jgi:hypothetical protein
VPDASESRPPEAGSYVETSQVPSILQIGS